MTKHAKLVAAVLAVGVMLAGGRAAQAQCNLPLVQRGPIDPANGFPKYYVDSNGLALAACLNFVCDPALPVPDPLSPISFPDNFPDEFFFFRAIADAPAPLTGSLVLALEGAFANNVVAGDQMVFTRVRIRILGGLAPNTQYFFDHPYGTTALTTDGLGIINDTQDVGIIPIGLLPTAFDLALNGNVGPFIRFLAGPVPPLPGQIGTSVADQTVQGSPCGQNFFRVRGPGLGGGVTQTLFNTLIGEIAPLCGDGTINPGEQCDDGNTVNGDCCSSTCQFEAAASPCTPMGPANPCIAGTTCNGAGVCGGGTPTTAPCSDGDACTAGDVCAGGTCQPGAPLVCDDLNVCTTDSCVPATGCVFTNNTAPCTDGDACTNGDTCAGGACQPGAPVVCNDLNVCTTDSCVPATGCVFTNNTAPCDDANICTAGDTCGGGSCQPGAPVTCPTAAPLATVDADATVSSDAPGTNFGLTTQINADAGPAVKQTFIRMSVSGVGNRVVTSAKLQLKVAGTSNANSVTGGNIHRITNCGWSETGLTFSNKPVIDGPVLQTLGAVALNQVVEFDLSSQIGGDGTYCFAIDSSSTDGVDYNSRQASTVANRPQLILTTSCPCAGPAPTCGDNVVNQPSEQCDGTSSAACPGQCQANCTCPAVPAPFCGDNVVNQPSEQCDGTSSAACPGQCQANCTCPAAPPTGPVTATVIADAAVDSSKPTSNLGTKTQINADAGPTIKRTFLKIQVSNVGSQTVTSALLNLRVATTTNAQSSSGGQIHRISDCSWSETGITYNNQPAIDGPVLSSLGPVALGQAVSFDITAGLPGDGTYCFAIDSLTTDGVDYNSRQASSVANRPTVSLTVAP